MNDGRTIGYAPDEIRTDGSTRDARLKWVIVVDSHLPAGPAANAVACVASATTADVPGLLGPAAADADGTVHAGLPWAGCTVLGADAERLARLRRAVAGHDDVHVADMPVVAQHTRVYDEYLARVGASATDALACAAISVVGPRRRVDKLVGGLSLLG